MIQNVYAAVLQVINTAQNVQRSWRNINDPVLTHRKKKLAELQKAHRFSFHGSLLRRTRGDGFLNLSSIVSISKVSVAKIVAALAAIILVGLSMAGYLSGTDLTTILVFIVGGLCVAGV